MGAVDDAVRHPGPTLDQLREAGFGAVGVTSFWQPGLSAPTPEELGVLRDVAARADGTRIFLSVYQPGSATTPLTAEARAQFASYVGRDRARRPRDPRHRRRQRAEPEPLLAAAVRRVRERRGRAGLLRASGGGVRRRQGGRRGRRRSGAAPSSPRGIDRPGTGRDTQSPDDLHPDLGAAYRASGREEPPLDGFAFHPYPASSSIPPDRPTDPASTSILLADYEEKLAPLLEEAFGPGLPVLYSELGVETAIPPAKASLYEGTEPGKPVDEPTQADYYRRAIELASCQKDVVGLLLFHSHDEPALTGFQSGVYYVDGTPKTSLEPVRTAIQAAGC